MSSKPYPAGARRVVELVRKIQLLDTEDTVLRKHNARLHVVIDETKEAQKELSELLDSMDCDRPGNYGWDARFGWLLSEVVKNAMEQTQPRCDECSKWYDEHPTGDCRLFVPYDVDKARARERDALAELKARDE